MNRTEPTAADAALSSRDSSSRGSSSGGSSFGGVCLVSMPYASVSRPSMALGLLAGILERDGVPVTTAHANLWFAERVGLPLYDVCEHQSQIQLLVGEWTFAEAAFPEELFPGARDKDEQYLDLLEASGVPAPWSFPGGWRAALRTLRRFATEFVDEAAQRVLATGARVVGCTSTFEQHVASLALLRRIRELDPDVITMMGGANCEAVMGEATHRCFPWVDYVVSGEADGLITPLCRTVLERGWDVPADELPRGVLGPAHRLPDPAGPAGHREKTAAGSPGSGPPLPRAVFRQLDSLPVPNFQGYFDELSRSSRVGPYVTPGLPLETSRGCWWGDSHHCTFCGLNGSSMVYDSKSPERVREEMAALTERYGLKRFECVDNILDMGYFTTLLTALAQEKDPERALFYEIKANANTRQIETLVDAGVTWVQPGIESLHTEMLKLMDKGVRGWQNIQLLKRGRQFGLRMSWSLLWGFPGDSDAYYAQMAEWVPLLEHLEAPQGTALLRFDRFSVYEKKAQEHGLFLSPIPSMHYVYPLAHSDLEDLTYFFSDTPALGVPDTLLRPVRKGKGIQALQEVANQWKQAFHDTVRPVLAMTDVDGELHILDTRRCAERTRMRLTGVARAVVLACDAAPRPAKLREILRRDHDLDVAQATIDAAVESLVERRLLLEIDDRLVTLAIPGTIPSLPTGRDFPGGFVDAFRATQDSARARRAEGAEDTAQGAPALEEQR
ncbi:RiPP maturation radical SAM C-methyltransferase [Streptomyces sp. NBC_00286]|uniref:RiPP maturation radical SAM C-methyltransferase n=1 Tax=Streptomyces sp. NBC_00286 TaxID=2975701 RepID=UPI002E2CD475|nr:RiPP maturation radical SAM C-methyltransferase [Streptomyces sp. NBC_00286]